MFSKYYQSELSYLRELGREFKRHPGYPFYDFTKQYSIKVAVNRNLAGL